MRKKLTNIAFVAVILLILLAGLAKTVFFPKDVVSSENRYAEKLLPISIQSFLDGSFQESVDAALSDQVQLSEVYKKIYNVSHSIFKEKLLVPVSRSQPDRYITFSNMLMFGGTHLTYYTRTLASMEESLTKTAESHNALFAAYPELDFYLYFIEKDTEINFATGEQIGVDQFLREHIDLPEDRIDHFPVDDFDTFSRCFFRTDHHWNYAGAYEGYLDLLNFLGVEEAPLQPQETLLVSQSFSGSKAGMTGAFTLSEPLYAYRFTFPQMAITINGQPAEDYGQQDAFSRGDVSGEGCTYGTYFGGDMGEIIFDTGTTGRGNLLVIGESFDNAILKLLASHFDRTHSIDLRYYFPYMAKDFNLGSYAAEHDIDRVLFIGNSDFYVSDDFRLEG